MCCADSLTFFGAAVRICGACFFCGPLECPGFFDSVVHAALWLQSSAVFFAEMHVSRLCCLAALLVLLLYVRSRLLH